MRAVLAILKDSFREAMASRVLWIALITIAVVLLALLPIGLRTDRSMRLRQQELTDAEILIMKLAEQQDGSTTAAGHLRSLLSSEQRAEIQKWLKDEDVQPGNAPQGRRNRSLRNQVIRLVNELLKKPDFYAETAWQQINLDEPTRDLLAMASRTESDQQFLHLKLLQAAFPDSISLKDDPAIIVTYAGSDMTDPIDILPAQFERLLDGIIVGVLSVFLGFFGVFGSLLVTASIIPRTFEPGEISLLLSKPISRTLLFLTKFVGGCAFTFICAVLLVTGVWLILGLRLNTWRPELLWCIPVYVFLFAIYFSVSAVTGAIWRNANVSLILVVVFWVVLFTIGAARTVVVENVIKSRRITEITPAGKELFAVDGSRTVYRWDSDTLKWSEVFIAQSQGVPRFVQRLMSSGTRFLPIYDARNERLLALQPEPSRFGGLAPATIVSGSADGGWERETEGRTPEPVIDMLISREGRIILPARRSILEFVGQSEQEKKTQEYFGNLLGGLIKPSARQAFREIQAEKLPTWSENAASSMDLESDALLIFDKGVIYRFARNEQELYAIDVTRDFEKELSGVVTAAGGSILLAMADGSVHLLDATTLSTLAETQLIEGDAPMKAASFSGEGRMALLTHEGHVILGEASSKSLQNWDLRLDGEVSAIAFNDDGHLLIANGRRSVLAFEGDVSLASEDRRGTEDWVYTVFDLILDPLYHLLPRPSDMDNAVKYLITGEKSVVIDDSGNAFGSSDVDNLKKDRITFDIWRPIFTNAAFIGVVLMIGCIYIRFYDF